MPNWVWWMAGAVCVALLLKAVAGGAPPAAVAEKIRRGAAVIDVRTPREFAAGAYPGARNIPLAEIASRCGEIGDKNTPVVVYCHSGMRSVAAWRLLRRAGFADVTNGGGLARMPPGPGG